MLQKFKPCTKSYIINNVTVMKYIPQVKTRYVKQRQLTSFMHVINGKYHYKSNYVDFYVESGDTVYIPCGASYTYRIFSEKTECIQAEFNFECIGENSAKADKSSSQPVVIKKKENDLGMIFSDMIYFSNDEFMILSYLYKLFATKNKIVKKDELSSSNRYKIEPALEYIEHNFINKICVADIAEACNMSESHLRRLFKKYMGISLMDYKNSKLIGLACNMLQCGGVNITETAYALNFNDIYTFSRFFKRETGISPKQYIEINRNKIEAAK